MVKLRHAERGRTIADLAAEQYGVLGRSQLLGLGVPERTIEEWLLCGRLHPLHRDSYALGHRLINRRGLWLAAVLACGEGALLSHLSAAALWGLTGPLPRVDVTAPRGRQGLPRRSGIRLHRGKIDSADREERDDIPVTSLARTLFDVSEAVDYERLKRMSEEADRLRLLRVGELERLCERRPGRHALRPVRRLLGEISAPTETRSPLEDRFAAFREAAGLPPPATNVLLLDHEVDCLWPAARLVVELDSWEFHRHRAAFRSDRARDSALLVAGYRTVRVTHERLDREASTLLAELRALLAVADE